MVVEMAWRSLGVLFQGNMTEYCDRFLGGKGYLGWLGGREDLVVVVIFFGQCW